MSIGFVQAAAGTKREDGHIGMGVGGGDGEGLRAVFMQVIT